MMGGASEHDEAMKWFLRRCNGGDVLVLRASGSNGYNAYLYSQLGISVNSVESIVFHNATASYDAYVLEKIMQAEGIWFAGGDQWDYVSYWKDTPVDSLINIAIQSRRIAIGGTSAGMAILGGFYFSAQNGSVTSEEALDNPYDNNVKVDSTDFLNVPFLDNVITDTHYSERDRQGRHVVFLARIFKDWDLEAKGIACDERTAVCIDTNGRAFVYGDFPSSDDNAFFIQTNCEFEVREPEICADGIPLTWDLNANALKVYKVKGTFSGMNTFDLNDWTTGSGGVWEHWSVENGNLNISNGSQINCESTAVESSGSLADNIAIYPNPCFAPTLTITYSDIHPNSIEIFSMDGRMMYYTNHILQGKLLIEVSDFPSGLYVISIRTNDSVVNRKIVIWN